MAELNSGDGGGGVSLTVSLTRHPLWPELVDVYFACIKARAEREERARIRRL